jgi:hypothetical protein
MTPEPLMMEEVEMADDIHNAELRGKTQQLLHGALRHVRAAALAATLIPLGSVAATQAVAQNCGSGGCAEVAMVPSPCDFVTSGGFVVTDGSAMANFGAHGGCKKGAFWGHVNYVDQSTDFHVDSTRITGYLTSSNDPTIRDICGVADTNTGAAPVLFRVRLVDNGEPGSSDVFGIRLSTGYHVSTRSLGAGFAGGGNVDLHDPNPSTTAPNPTPDELTMCGGVAAP